MNDFPVMYLIIDIFVSKHFGAMYTYMYVIRVSTFTESRIVSISFIIIISVFLLTEVGACFDD